MEQRSATPVETLAAWKSNAVFFNFYLRILQLLSSRGSALSIYRIKTEKEHFMFCLIPSSSVLGKSQIFLLKSMVRHYSLSLHTANLINFICGRRNQFYSNQERSGVAIMHIYQALLLDLSTMQN